MKPALGLVVLISGRGSNLRAIADAIAAGTLSAKILLVLCNRPDAPGLALAAERGLATAVVDHQTFENRGAFDRALQQRVAEANPDLVVLAGFMRLLGRDFVTHYGGRLVNIHPSLLPAYPGLDTHRRVLAAGDKQHGCSVHYVTPKVDAGPVIQQLAVPVLADDDETSLAQRLLRAEHQLYPETLALIAEGRVQLKNDQVFLDGRAITSEESRRVWHEASAVS